MKVHVGLEQVSLRLLFMSQVVARQRAILPMFRGSGVDSSPNSHGQNGGTQANPSQLSIGGCLGLGNIVTVALDLDTKKHLPSSDNTRYMSILLILVFLGRSQRIVGLNTVM